MGGHDVSSDNQMRNIFDEVPVELIRFLLPTLFEKNTLPRLGKDFTTALSSGADQGSYEMLRLDGSDYFHSTRFQCPDCLQRQDNSGQVHFRPTVLSGTFVKSGSHQVLLLNSGRSAQRGLPRQTRLWDLNS